MNKATKHLLGWSYVIAASLELLSFLVKESAFGMAYNYLLLIFAFGVYEPMGLWALPQALSVALGIILIGLNISVFAGIIFFAVRAWKWVKKKRKELFRK